MQQDSWDGIPVQRLATLVRDGPNMNKTIFHKLNKLIKEDHLDFPGLVYAFNKGMEQYGKEVDQFCLDLHTLFKYSAARQEDFKGVPS